MLEALFNREYTFVRSHTFEPLLEEAMKKLLALALLPFIFVRPALADHIGIYSDQTGTSCLLAAGFSHTATVLHRFSAGAMASFFTITATGGSNVFALESEYPVVGSINSSLLVSYGQCLSGTIVVGKVVGVFLPGIVSVTPAPGYDSAIYENCASIRLPATGGQVYIGGAGNCVIAVEPSTWGAVKALYRD